MRLSIARSPKSGRPVTPAASSKARTASSLVNCVPMGSIIVSPMTVVELPLLRRQGYVDGRWIDADSGDTFPVTNPATGEVLADVPRMGSSETRRALEAAQRALPD